MTRPRRTLLGFTLARFPTLPSSLLALRLFPKKRPRLLLLALVLVCDPSRNRAPFSPKMKKKRKRIPLAFHTRNKTDFLLGGAAAVLASFAAERLLVKRSSIVTRGT